MKPHAVRKSVTDKEILDWIAAYRPFIVNVWLADSIECEVTTKGGCWRRKTLRSAVRAAISGVRE